MQVIKLIVLLGKFQIHLYASEDFVIKETYDNSETYSRVLYDFRNCLLYSEYFNTDTIIKGELEEIDYIGETWTLEGFNLSETLDIGSPFLYKNYPSIEVNQSFSWPNSTKLVNSRAIYSSRTDIDSLISDKRILKILFLKDRATDAIPYNCEIKRIFYINGTEFIHKEINEITIIEQDKNFFTNTKIELEEKLASLGR